jgi:hypothetical protein
LHTGTLAIERLATTGTDPGWISRHEVASSARGAITVRRGQREIQRDDRSFLRESIDDYTLDLSTLVWTQLTDRRWQQYEVTRADGRIGDLWDVSQLVDYLGQPTDDELAAQQVAHYRERLGREPDLDAWRTRFQPPVPHDVVPNAEGDDWRVHRIRVDGTVVRYVDDHRGARVVIEGPLPTSSATSIIEDVRTKLSRADASPHVAIALDDARADGG